MGRIRPIRGAFVVITTSTTEKIFGKPLGTTAESRLRMASDGFQKDSRSDRKGFQNLHSHSTQDLQSHKLQIIIAQNVAGSLFHHDID